MKIRPAHEDWVTLSPELSLLGAGEISLMLAVLVPRGSRRPLSAFTAFTGFITAGVFAGVVYDRSANAVLEVGNAIARDRLGAFAAIIVAGTGVLAILVSYAERMADDHIGE